MDKQIIYVVFQENLNDIDQPFMMSLHQTEAGAKKEIVKLTALEWDNLYIIRYELKQ